MGFRQKGRVATGGRMGGDAVPWLTAAAGAAALWRLWHPAAEAAAAPDRDDEPAAALQAENAALRDRLTASREEQTSVLRLVEELRGQLQRLEEEANPIKRKSARLKEQLEMERQRHAENTQGLSAEAARLRDYSNELIFTMIMNGVSPDAMSVPHDAAAPADGSPDPREAAAGRDPELLVELNGQLTTEVARLRATLARAVRASAEVADGVRRTESQMPRPASGVTWDSPEGIGELAGRRRRAALETIEPMLLSPAISPATTPIKDSKLGRSQSAEELTSSSGRVRRIDTAAVENR